MPSDVEAQVADNTVDASAMSGAADRNRLARALAGTSAANRQLADLGLPAVLNSFVSPSRVAKMRSAAVLVAVIADVNGPHVLLTQRSTHLRNHSGQVSLPGGSRDPDDSDVAETALRESHEEVGLNPDRVEILGYLDDYPTGSGFRITPVVGWVKGAFTPRVSEGEVAEVFRVPLEHVLAPASYHRKSFLRDGIKLPFFQLDWERHHVWGATAGILRNLCRRVETHGR